MGLLEWRSTMRDTGDRVRQFATAKLLGAMTDGANLPDDEQGPPQGGLLATPPFNPNVPQGLPNQNPSLLTPQAPPSALLQQSNQGLLGQMMGANPMQGAGPGLLQAPQGRSTSPGDDPNHAHRKGVRGLIRHAFGADRISPAVGAALSPEDREHFLNRGIISQLIERSRAGGEENEAINTLNLRRRTQQRERFEEIKKQAEQMPIGPERSEFYARALAELEPEAGVATNTAVGLREKEFAPQRVTWTPRSLLINGKAQTVLTSSAGDIVDPTTGTDLRATGAKIEPIPAPENFSVVSGATTPQGTVAQIGTKTGEVRDTGLVPASGASDRTQAAVRREVSSNRAQLGVIDEALAELAKYPKAIGLARAAGDAVSQRVDPEGVPARAAVANIGSLRIHDRTGAVMAAREQPRLTPFIPSVTDTYEAAVIKLKALKRELERETEELEKGASPESGGGKTMTRAEANALGPEATKELLSKGYRIVP